MPVLLLSDVRREVAANFRLAAPLIGAQMSFVGMGVLDTIMAGRLGERELAAIAVGANIWMQLFVLFMGICMACSSIVAQRSGARQAPAEIGEFVRQALLLSLGLGLLWFTLTRLLAAPLIGLLGLSAATAQLAHDYLLAESWGALLLCLCFTLRSSAEGLGLSRVALVAGLVALAVKAAANHALVYGHWGLPALGAVGFGWATVVASVAMLLIYGLQYRMLVPLRALQLLRGGWPRLQAPSLEVLRLGIPIGLILFAEVAFFGCTALLMARFGDTAVAAHQVALNFTSLLFMVPLGIGLATTVRVGHATGAGQRAQALLAGQTGMLMGLGFALFSAALMGLRPHWITAVYTRAPEVAALAQGFLLLAALFQLFDCLQATANGALRGIKDTQLPMLITVTAYWLIGMPAGAWLAFRGGHGPDGLWIGFIVGLAVAALGLSLRFLRKAG